MKKISFALISDSIFVALCAFLLGFTLIRFYVKSAVFALVMAIVAALFFGGLAFALLYRKRKKKLIYFLNSREKKTLTLHLSVSGEKYVSDLFKKALDGTYAVGNRLEDSENAYFFYFSISPLSPDNVAETIKCGTEKRKIIYCCIAGAEAENLASDFDVKIIQIGEVYELLKEKNLLPEKYACGEIKKQSAWKTIKKRFNRKLCPSLFYCGLSLLFFSFFTFYKIYYIVFGGLLLILAAVSLLISQPNS